MLLKICLSLAGIGLMYYEKVVDENMAAAALAKQEYKASCDMKVDFGFIEQEFSCSTILNSDYAVGFGFLQNVNIYYLFKSDHKNSCYAQKSTYLHKIRERENNKSKIMFRSYQWTARLSSQTTYTVSGTTSYNYS